MALQPIDYAAQVQSPFLQSIQGIQIGQQLGAMAQQARMRPTIEAQAAEKRQAIIDFVQNPNPMAGDYQRALLLNPEITDQIKQGWDAINTERKETLFRGGVQVLGALKSGQSDIARNLLLERAEAERNSGDAQQAQIFDTYAKLVDVNPAALQQIIGLNLAGADPTKFAESMERLELLPGRLREQEAKATGEEVKSKFAESDALMRLEKTGWDIKKIQNDMEVSRQNSAISALNAQIGREGNDLKRQELLLKLQERKDKLDETVRTRAAEATSALQQADTLLGSVQRALGAAVTKDGKPTNVARSATGPIQSRLFTVSQDVADFEETINLLGSQITMSRIGEMKGVLSDRDLEVLRSSLGNLSLRQSPEKLISNLQTIQRLTEKAKTTTQQKFGAPVSAPAGNKKRLKFNPETGRAE